MKKLIIMIISSISVFAQLKSPYKFEQEINDKHSFSELKNIYRNGHCGFPVKYGRIDQSKLDLRGSQFHFYLGSLGVKAIAHDKSFFLSYPQRSIYPKILTDKNSILSYNCFEVTKVLPSSPATGKLKPYVPKNFDYQN